MSSWSPKNCTCTDFYRMGLSASSIMGWGVDHPLDPSDLCRCLHVSRKPPAHMRARSRQWRVLVDHWDELAELLESEHESGVCVKTYARMRQLFTKVDRGLWCPVHRDWHSSPVCDPKKKTCVVCGRNANSSMTGRDGGFVCVNVAACLRRVERRKEDL